MAGILRVCGKRKGSTESRRVDLDQRRRTRKASKTIFLSLEDTKGFEIEEKGNQIWVAKARRRVG